MIFAELLLPVPLDQTFTYIIPDQFEAVVQVGQRVSAPFGRSHVYTGIIVALTPHRPETDYELRPILEVLPGGPVIRHYQHTFWQWMAHYYMCAIGEVMKAALPSLLKPEEGKEGTVRQDFKPKTRTMVRIVLKDDLKAAFDALQRSKQQQTLFMKLLDLSHALQKSEPDAVDKSQLLQSSGVSATVFNEVRKKGLLTTFEQEVSRLDVAESTQPSAFAPSQLNALSDVQQAAFRQVCHALHDHHVCLLHGVTSSGKTEIYMHLIHEVISQGRQALMMVPEIALTTQLCQRLRRVFGADMLVYHSKLSDEERVEIWQRMVGSGKQPRLILGVRSSIFLPFQQLGLIIVDEEHESSYKQQDPAPRYHGRDTAIVLAQRHGAKVVLGSATPSLESLWLAQQGRYALVSLTQRHAGVSLPSITLARFQPTSPVFTPQLLQRIGHMLSERQQAIIFQNRRGYAHQVECVQCGWTPHCPRCDVSLTYHKRSRQLECHYCGYRMPWPRLCPLCGGQQLDNQGFGTERIQEALQQQFPAVRTLRMDTDTTASRRSYEHIIDDFAEHRADVLIGTQMVTKGLDFAAVSTVGILNADTLMNIPDFRAHERAYQLMEQVAGRAGRREGQESEVIIQCHDTRHPLLRQVVNHDYHQMAADQLRDRQRYGYPPFTRLIMIYMKGRYEDRLDALMAQYAAQLRHTFGQRVLGPEAPAVSRVKNMFIRQIMLKVERDASVNEVRRLLRLIQQQMQQNDQEFARIVFYYDVDPV